MILVIIFAIGFILSTIIYLKTYNDLKKTLKQIHLTIDNIFFQLSKFSRYYNWEKKENLTEILYYPIKKFLNWFHYEIEDFQLFTKELEKNISDVSKILNQEILSSQVLADLDLLIDTAFTIKKINKITKFLTLFFGFWLILTLFYLIFVK